MNSKKVCLFVLAVAIVVVAIVFGQRSRAQSSGEDVDNRALDRLTRLAIELDARKDTNTLAEVVSLLAAAHAVRDTGDVFMNVALLEMIRSGQTNMAIDRLEVLLDARLCSMGRSTNEIGPSELKALKRAKDYRFRFPRKSNSPVFEEGVARAFELLGKENPSH